METIARPLEKSQLTIGLTDFLFHQGVVRYDSQQAYSSTINPKTMNKAINIPTPNKGETKKMTQITI